MSGTSQNNRTERPLRELTSSELNGLVASFRASLCGVMVPTRAGPFLTTAVKVVVKQRSSDGGCYSFSFRFQEDEIVIPISNPSSRRVRAPEPRDGLSTTTPPASSSYPVVNLEELVANRRRLLEDWNRRQVLTLARGIADPETDSESDENEEGEAAGDENVRDELREIFMNIPSTYPNWTPTRRPDPPAPSPAHPGSCVSLRPEGCRRPARRPSGLVRSPAFSYDSDYTMAPTTPTPPPLPPRPETLPVGNYIMTRVPTAPTPTPTSTPTPTLPSTPSVKKRMCNICLGEFSLGFYLCCGECKQRTCISCVSKLQRVGVCPFCDYKNKFWMAYAQLTEDDNDTQSQGTSSDEEEEDRGVVRRGFRVVTPPTLWNFNNTSRWLHHFRDRFPGFYTRKYFPFVFVGQLNRPFSSFERLLEIPSSNLHGVFCTTHSFPFPFSISISWRHLLVRSQTFFWEWENQIMNQKKRGWWWKWIIIIIICVCVLRDTPFWEGPSSLHLPDPWSFSSTL